MIDHHVGTQLSDSTRRHERGDGGCILACQHTLIAPPLYPWLRPLINLVVRVIVLHMLLVLLVLLWLCIVLLLMTVLLWRWNLTVDSILVCHLDDYLCGWET